MRRFGALFDGILGLRKVNIGPPQAGSAKSVNFDKRSIIENMYRGVIIARCHFLIQLSIGQIRTNSSIHAGIPDWLFDASYEGVGDDPATRMQHLLYQRFIIFTRT